MHKLKTLIRNVRKEYRDHSALFDWAVDLDPRNPRKQWDPDATGLNRTHLISIHPNSATRTSILCVKGDNYFK